MPDKENNFKDCSSLTNWVRYMLYAQMIVAVIAIGSNFIEYQLLSDYQNGVYTSQELAVADGETSDKRKQIIALIYLAVFIVSGFLILRWIHRSNFNARQLGANDMEFTPGWSIGYYFVPIFSLLRPYQAMKEIWKASHNPSNWQAVNVSSLLSIWWFLWIVTNILGQVIFRMSNAAEELPELMDLNLVSQISEVFSISLAIVTLSIVNKVFAAQMSAYECANKSIQPTER